MENTTPAPDLAALKARRQELRGQMKEYYKEGGGHALWNSKYKAINQELQDVHAQILAVEVMDPTLVQVRYTYEVCGYSFKHEYFRAKFQVCESLKEAEKVLKNLEDNPEWGIPTIIVKQTHRRADSFADDDFDTMPADQLSCSKVQELVGRKSMCGYKKHSWDYLFKGLNGRYTY